jgi:hypothetical protein
MSRPNVASEHPPESRPGDYAPKSICARNHLSDLSESRGQGPKTGPLASDANGPTRTSSATIAVSRLVVEPAAQLFKWDHHVFAVGTTILETSVPCLHVWHGWPLDFELEISKQRGAGRDVG